MKENRKHTRYDVSEYPEFSAHMVNGPIGERLMTVSVGGVGFWAPVEDFNLKIGQRTTIQFHVKGVSGQSQEVRGEVLYIIPHPLESQIGRFYGVRFEEESRAFVEQTVAQLEELRIEGRIKMA